MTTFVDDGVILRRIDSGEADRILTVLTREHGKVGVIARGVRKPRAKLVAATDLFCVSRMQLAHGRGSLLTLAQAERGLNAPTGTDALRVACAALIAELADRVLEDNHPDAETFDLITTSLRDILDPSRDPRAGVAWCARRLIHGLGYAPHLAACMGCDAEFGAEGGWFSAAAGGLLCAQCARHDTSAIACSLGVVKVLRCIQAGNRDIYTRIRFDDTTLSVLEDVVESELAHHLERRLKSLDVVRALRRR